MPSSPNADKENVGWAFFTIAVKGALDPAGGRGPKLSLACCRLDDNAALEELA